MKNRRILLIDSNDDMLTLISRRLEKAGATVYEALNGAEGLAKFELYSPELVIMDVILADNMGWQVCQRIRRRSSVPIVILTSLKDDKAMIEALTLGADDYLSHPVSPAILHVRLEALLRRAALPAQVNEIQTYQDGHLKIDLKKRSAEIAHRVIKFSRREFELLAYLVSRPNELCSFDQILTDVWGPNSEGFPQYIHVYISRLRQKLQQVPQCHTYLQTEHGVGYRFVPKPAQFDPLKTQQVC